MPYEGPIHLDLNPQAMALSAKARAREVRCVCDRSPFCRGQASADWLTCNRTCRACKPTPFRPPVPVGEHLRGEQADG
jgi:hypothetical protein